MPETSGREKLRLRCPVAVEGKYDKIRLDAVVATPILVLNGFSVFRDEERLELLRRVVRQTGLILFTDSDRAGAFLRSRLKGLLPKETGTETASGTDARGKLFQVYAPPVPGREKRKKAPSADGILGVEGTDTETLYRVLLPFALGRDSGETGGGANITKQEWYADGFSGQPNAETRRKALAEALDLPETLSSNALLEAVNLLVTRERYEEIKACLEHASES